MKLSFRDSFELSISLLKRVLLAQFLFLLLMFIFRVLFYFEFSANEEYKFSEIISAYIMGVRLDLVVLGYVQALISIVLFIFYFLRSYEIYMFIKRLLPYYLLSFYLIITSIIATDFGYFSFFNEHITLMIYGIIDDDTAALWRTMQANYNIFLIFFISIIYIVILKFLLKILFLRNIYPKTTKLKTGSQISILILIILINILIIRGSIGMFPLSKIIPDVSTNKFINELSNNGVIAFIKATKLYKKSKSGNYDLIKSTNFNGKMYEAFSILTQKNISKNDNFIESITYKTDKNETLELLKPHVVVVMVESFGLAITKYQSETFNILGKLQKHFQEDTLFTNFISASNGTIVSLEPLLLNTTARPNSTSLAQSKYQRTPFTQAAAKVYKNAGYETSFIYGGDLKWRNVGKFMSYQGFDNQNGKINIIKSLKIDEKESSHDWGVFDQYAYDYVIKLLKEAKKPQFIFLLTTNNHPPFKTPEKYKHNSLVPPQDLKEKMIGDKELIQKRLLDYQYAVDMAGMFMDKVKNSKLKNNTVVAITADNNTIE
jgi:phosphoglycerol transferase MdoB-like AlkP superfamily enzyme